MPQKRRLKMLKFLRGLFYLLFGGFMFIVSFLLWSIFFVCLLDTENIVDFEQFTLYSTIFIVFALVYVIYQRVSKQHYSDFLFISTLLLWIYTALVYVSVPARVNTYLSIIVVGNCLFYFAIIMIPCCLYVRDRMRRVVV